MQLDISIPDKNEFKQSEVCAISGIKSYVLRFWESEFDVISPMISSDGQKIYGRNDLIAVIAVKKLLFEEKFTIDRAKNEIYQIISQYSDVGDQKEISTVAKKDLVKMPKNYNERDVQKLVIAKAKLTSMISLIDEIKELNNW